MATSTFQLVDMTRAMIDGDAIIAGEAMVNGNLVNVRLVGAQLTARLTGAGSAPHIDGFAYLRRTIEYRPTSIAIASGLDMNVIRGAGMVRVDSSLFTEAAIPAVNARIFGGANGLMTVTAGTNQAIGRCTRQDPVLNWIGTGTAANQAVIEFFFTPRT